MSSSSQPREQWASRLGFTLAAIGSAVGLGNMWRFPYLTAENGGAAFLILYILMVFVLGLPIMLAEFVIGRGAKKSPIQALEHYGGRAWKPVGIAFVVTGFVILSYYGVIAGWTLRYAGRAVLGGFPGSAAERFQEYSGGGDAVVFQVLFMAITIGIVMGGIKKGIERTALILMPLLFLIVVGIAIYAATLNGAGGGYRFYLHTDFRDILSLGVLTQAAGQAFYSLSLGMGAMLTFASYLSGDANLPRQSLIISVSDFAVAFVAGLMVFPLIFALGLSGEVGESTIGALFISLPQAFSQMGSAGPPIGLLFFVALIVGALTSAISLLEVVTASTMDSLGWSRHKAALGTGVVITALGIPAALNLDVLGAMDALTNNLLILVGALALAVFVGWIMPDATREARKGAESTRWFPVWRNFLRFVAPALLVLILIRGVPAALDALRALLGGGGG
ncbi:MAG: sodium-dependent transporter [Gemmatimonadota bacterium]